MDLRKRLEESELMNLSPYAAKSALSKGRLIPEKSCDIRTEFQRDRDRIIHSKAFRRLKDKMQVYISPNGDHIRTRLVHTLEVSQISRTISRALNLNEDLTEAIALGHDLGHAPFGHSGEYALDSISPYGFSHNNQSLRLVDNLERDGRGLRLTFETRDGILNHRTGMKSATLEGKVVQISDKIAYLNHDIDDSIRSGVLKITDVPKVCTDALGDSSRQRINTMIHSVISESYGKNEVNMEKQTAEIVKVLRDFMFEHVYLRPARMTDRTKIVHVITELYNHYLNTEPESIEEFAKAHGVSEDALEVKICDYISGMTDRYAISKYSDIFLPQYSSF